MVDPSRCLFGTLLLSVSLTAQSAHPPLGPFSSTGFGFVRPGPGNDLIEYRADRHATQPFGPIGQNGPDFRIAAIFHQLTATELQQLDLDGISSGSDQFWVVTLQNQLRLVQQGPLGWSALLFSVRNGTPLATAPEPILSRYLSGGAGADLYSWITPGSSQLGGFESGRFLEVPARALGIPQGQEISGIDIPMALMAQSQLSQIPIFAPHPDEFYFSLTKASAGQLNGHFPNIGATDMSGATVFRVRWYTGSGWGNIEVAVTADELGLDHDNLDPTDDEDLDALAVDAEDPTSPRVIFSVRAPSSLAQLNYYRKAGFLNAGLGELFDAGGNPMQNQVGNSDIDAVCGIDPEFVAQLSPWLGTPQSSVTNPPLILSATHMISPTTGLNLVIEANGPDLVASDMFVATPGVFFLEASLGGPGSMPSWDVLMIDNKWSGFGTWRTLIPRPGIAGAATQWRAHFYSFATNALVESSTVFIVF